MVKEHSSAEVAENQLLQIDASTREWKGEI
jgi:hypothetical protein